MLNCNIVDQLYNQIRKKDFNLCFNETTLISMAQKQLRYDLGCTGVNLCYTPETCDGIVTVTCNITLSQNIDTTSCSMTIVQSFDDP